MTGCEAQNESRVIQPEGENCYAGMLAICTSRSVDKTHR